MQLNYMAVVAAFMPLAGNALRMFAAFAKNKSEQKPAVWNWWKFVYESITVTLVLGLAAYFFPPTSWAGVLQVLLSGAGLGSLHHKVAKMVTK